MMKAIIINIGDEVLSGKVINTNQSYLSIELNKLGIDVVKTIVIPDNEEDIKHAIAEFKNSKLDILITTGGLGPTHDDMTKEVIANELNIPMYLDQTSLTKLGRYFGKDIPKSNEKQAYFPTGSVILDNSVGTANGFILHQVDKHYIILVGPPAEMHPMFKDSCIPYLNKLIDDKFLVEEYLVMGEGESYFEDYLKPLLSKLKNVTISPYASIGKIRFVIKTTKKYEEEFSTVNEKFKSLMTDYIISNNGSSVEEIIHKLLDKNEYSISFAESITGGMIAAKFINVAGASKYLKESLITYSDQAKIKYLKVKQATLTKHTAVSKEVAIEMVNGLHVLTNSNVCLAITGYANHENPSLSGQVYIGIIIDGKKYQYDKKFIGPREIIRKRATLYSLYLLYKLLK